ncbi:MAG: ribosome silencing factor [Fimbriimonadaceae bacterium]|nr:ribosome silencing factor [Fimbriimonadaceae bacterium]QYK59389.1 MAG: ribosome silencing factor [Fimbriimonadaceae bacterium]
MKSDKKPTAPEKAALICEFADDMKAERIERLDVHDKTAMMDYMIVCTGTSDTHVNAIAERVAEKLRDLGIKPLRTPKSSMADGWVLYDYGDVVFHVMLEEKRQYYDLETLWRTMQPDPNLID